jgi:tRNA pseudouridine38-40 synthase
VAVYRLVLQYDGSSFSGWQRQPTGRTIQQVLEETLTGLYGGETITCHASGRTDAGVHALGQVVSFRAETPRDPDRMRLGLNTLLPASISCVAMEIAPDDFHARFSCTGKRYRYVLYCGRDRSPFWWRRSLHVRVPVDWGAVEAGLEVLEGRHDFSAFRAAGCSAKSPVRTIHAAEHHALGDEHHLEFTGEGFLRHQVRRMVGTLLEVGRGRRSVDDLREILESRDRARSGKTALPDGLFLVGAFYGER